MLGTKEIQEITPYRHPLLLADCIGELEPGVRAVGYKCVIFNEPFFAGYFPGKLTMSGVLIIETLAQAGSVVILSMEVYKGKIGYSGTISDARSKQIARPGNRLRSECEIVKQKGPTGIGKVTAVVDGKLAANAELTFVVEQGIEADV